VLTDPQIDRYSRQIILPEVGGRGQERLLAARIALLAENEDLTPALNYLAGAGIGTIRLDPAAGDGALSRAAAGMRELNPDVSVEVAPRQGAADEMLVVLAGTNRTIEAARRANQSGEHRRVIFARLGEPYLVAILESRPPCLACAHDGLLAAIAHRGPLGALVAMVAAAETLKSLLAVASQPSRLIEFNGYESRSSELPGALPPDCCVCG
jgi:hypothetical protein